ncbi:MAG: ArsR family transcriptional regulator [Deltaproteobacteria bacterium]|nr:ArsR family transcriptional regulator [Deltaproteobacteria bacterium]
MLLPTLFGNETAEFVLLYMVNYGAGYAKRIANVMGKPVSQIQRQLIKLEREGVLVSRSFGKTRVFQWNPRFMMLKELKALLDKELRCLPRSLIDKYFRERMRPGP